jgi:DNA-binding response OmpR family regulator
MSKYIMVIDPSRTIQIILSIYLQNAGHLVFTYSTPQEALYAFSVLQDIPDLIFIFLEFEKPAYDLIAHVQSQAAFARTRMVAMVLQEEQAAIQRRAKWSRVSYLVKPFQIQDVLALVSAPGGLL